MAASPDALLHASHAQVGRAEDDERDARHGSLLMHHAQYVFSTPAATDIMPRKTFMLDMICIMEPSI